MWRINRSVPEQGICAPAGGTWPGETPDLGQGEQRAHQPTGPPSYSGLEPHALTRSLGLGRGPRLPPNDREGARIRTTLPALLGPAAAPEGLWLRARSKGRDTGPRSLRLTRGAATRTRRNAARAAQHLISDSAHRYRKCRCRKRTVRTSARSTVQRRIKSSETVARRRGDRPCRNWEPSRYRLRTPGATLCFPIIPGKPFLPPLLPLHHAFPEQLSSSDTGCKFRIIHNSSDPG